MSKRLRDLLVLMRSLIISPDILLSELSKDAVFSKSADQFYNALLSHEEMPAWEPQLLKSLLVDFATIVADCPKEYSTIPYTFTLALAYAMYKDNKKVEDFFGVEPSHLYRITRSCELFAEFCEVSPLFAFQLTESLLMWPNQNHFDGNGLERAPLLPQFFSFRTISSPIWVNDHLMYVQSDLTDEALEPLVATEKKCLLRMHKAQHTILRTFLTTSYVSRDYILSYVATLAEANISRRANPTGLVSSEGLLINMVTALMSTIKSTLAAKPNRRFAKQFFSYIFSDLGRIDFIKRDFPADMTMRTHLFNLINWLRPQNSLARQCDSAKWWKVIRSGTDELTQLLNDGLECKPHSSFKQFVRAMRGPTDAITFSPSVVSLKSFFDYSYNYFITGMQPSRVMPSFFQTVKCSRCSKEINQLPCYRCICCTSFFLCEPCYQKEVEIVCKAFRPPFDDEVQDLLLSKDEVSRLDSHHNPYTHFFTELQHSTVIISNRPVFMLSPSFSPRVPHAYEMVRKNANLEDTPETRPKLVDLYKHVGPVEQDEEYEYWEAPSKELVEKYRSTLCLCYTDYTCHCHGPLTQAVRRAGRKEPLSLNDVLHPGFAMHCQCYYCKTSPIIGTVYYCLHCALRLCRLCYERDMKQGAGTPGHQCNHVFVLIYHPVQNDCLIDHNRNDMRTVPSTVTVLPNSITMSGVTLDMFMPTEEDKDCNQNNLAIEVFMLTLRLMMVGTVGFFQEYENYNQYQRLSRILQFRAMQLCVSDSLYDYLRMSEHISFALLQLITLHTPKNHPLSSEWELVSDVTDDEIKVKILPRSLENHSLLWDLVVKNVTVSPLFKVISPSMVDVVLQTIDFYMRQVDVDKLQEDLNAGYLDYSLLLLLLCSCDSVISNKSLRFDVIQTLFVMCTITRSKDRMSFLFEFPFIRHALTMFSQKAFIDSTTFNDPTRSSLLQLQTSKILILLFRSTSVRVTVECNV